MVRVILVVILAGLLTACGIGGGPGRAFVEKAIALQVSQTQQELSQQLDPNSPSPQFEISQVKISEQKPLMIQNLRAYQVRGTYDLILELRDRRVTQRQNPFEVHLQRQVEGNWRFARPQADKADGEGSRWVTQLLQ